jgi:hypothetical protein
MDNNRKIARSRYALIAIKAGNRTKKTNCSHKALNRNATMAEDKDGYPAELEKEGPYKVGARVRIDAGRYEGFFGEVVGYSDKGRWVCVRCRWTDDEASVDYVTGKFSRHQVHDFWALTDNVGWYDPR